MRKSSSYFLLNWQKESGRERECDEPHGDNWLEAILPQCLLTNFKKYECGYTRDKQSNADCQRSFGEWGPCATSRL
jgi:hypothetical protein